MDVAALKQAFAAFDSDNDGAVTVALLQRLFTTLGMPVPPEEELATFIRAVEDERHVNANEISTLPPVRGIEVGESASPTETPPRRHYSSPDLLRVDVQTARAPHQHHSRTMWEVFEASVQRFPDNHLLGSRTGPTGPYVWVDYRTVYDRVCALGRAFANLGLAAGDLVGVMLPTCEEWTVSQLALWSQSLTTVTLYETYGPDAISFILKQAELSVVITTGSKVQQLLDLATSSHLKTIISSGTPVITSNPNNVQVLELAELERQGATLNTPLRPPSSNDRLFIVYTSGTTGDPKGVVHTHDALVANVGAALRNLPLQPDEVHFAFLPMAHIMEQFIEAIVIAVGGSIGYWSQNIRILSDDIQALRPTMFIGVPRVLNRYFDSIKANFDAAQGPKRLLIEWAMESKRLSLAKGRFLSFWDLFVFRHVAQQALGGRVRFIATGSAPISPELLELFRLCFSCCIIEGYGMTEVLVVSGTPQFDTSKRSHVGAPWDAVEIKLVDVPDMNYLSTDQPFPRGEICFRGPLVMREYFRDPVRTAEALDADGWLHSGDIGCWLEDGHLRILDRKKNIFKLSNGEYVQPEKLEQLYVQSKFVAQIFIDGSPLEAQLVAVIVPDPARFAELAAAGGLATTDVAAVLASDAVKRAVVADLDLVAANHKLNAYERIAAVHLAAAEFPPELLTPTFKLKRNVARQFYQDQVAALYAKLNGSS